VLPEVSQLRSCEPSTVASAGTGIVAGTASQSGPPKQYSPAPTTCAVGVAASASKTVMAKSVWSLLPLPQPPAAVRAPMTAALRSETAAPETSSVHGTAPENSAAFDPVVAGVPPDGRAAAEVPGADADGTMGSDSAQPVATHSAATTAGHARLAFTRPTLTGNRSE
jgi:hypothetical protein